MKKLQIPCQWMAFGFLFVMMMFQSGLFAQKASVKEQTRALSTYPFSDPDPVPILTSNSKIYPYFKYEGYSHDSKSQEWKVVKLENDYVEVFVLPEVGGKVWGAIEKSTGEEFIYRNEVMKFRNISMRGPWTSGGIEFNFGIIGHHPSTATPVDYILQEEEDGSVSCTVGNIDLPSRTQWRVKIVLPKDKACFETEALWYNPSPMNQSYYNWMTAAAPARQDFEFYTPGDEYLKHSGEAKPWPYDEEKRNLSLYKENNFGPSKSYHVVGEYNDFFGGYYHDAGYGFGHWGEYEEIPGQKLWLWALSRSGGIWEDLLTDTDGQYIEFQAGRQFVQYSRDAHVNPVTEANFEPYSADQWREVWFPVKKIGGMVDVSEMAVMNVTEEDGKLQISLNPFQKTNGILKVKADGKVIHEQTLELAPMAVFSQEVDLKGVKNYIVQVAELDLNYTSNRDSLLIERPFLSNNLPSGINSAEKIYREGMEEMKFRHFAKAMEKFEQAVKADPYHAGALVGIAELFYRSGRYVDGLHAVNKALQLDTYDPHANYVAGILYRGKGDKVNAKEAFGWAARSMNYRSNAYAQIAEILLSESDYDKAKKYANKSLDFNRYNINALEVLAVSARKKEDNTESEKVIANILEIDPLNHFAYFERFLSTHSAEDKSTVTNSHRSELAYQTYLELAIDYANKGLTEEAIEALELAPQHPVIDLWFCYLKKDASSKYFNGIAELSPELVFPFRRETIEALEWANEHTDNWKLQYYLALNFWGKDRLQEAAIWMNAVGQRADYAPFYLSRAHLLKTVENKDPISDLKKAHDLDKKDWRTWRALTEYYSNKGEAEKAVANAKAAYKSFDGNYMIGMDYAGTLNQIHDYETSLGVLKKLDVLPFEGAGGGRRLYEQAHYGEAINQINDKKYIQAIDLLEQSKVWDEQLGVGQPFDVDERVADYLIAYSSEKIGEKKQAKKFWNKTAVYSAEHVDQRSFYHLLGLKALEATKGEEAAKAFLEQLQKSSHSDSPVSQWVVASYLGNEEDQRNILASHPELAKSEQMILLQGIIAMGG